MIDFNLDISQAESYKSKSQKIRVITEKWVQKHSFCPNCGCDICDYPNNRAVADFYCSSCFNDYELKSKEGSPLVKKIVDGAYDTMIERLQSSTNPSLFFLSYAKDYAVNNLILIPKQFFITDIIEKRKPLSQTAKRAGWVGCNILIDKVPNRARIHYVKNGKITPKENILRKWEELSFVNQISTENAKGWLFDIMMCIDNLRKSTFTLSEMYSFENILSKKYASNMHVKDKIRQQLQILRDRGYIDFVSRGVYRIKSEL